MTILEANRIVAFGLVVLIWMVQLVVYPAFAEIDPGRFTTWHSRYTQAITWIVAPLMFGQTALVVLLVYQRPGVWTVLTALMVAVAWVTTATLSVPCHDRLQAGGLNVEVVARLIATNWIRTAAWTLAFLFLAMARIGHLTLIRPSS